MAECENIATTPIAQAKGRAGGGGAEKGGGGGKTSAARERGAERDLGERAKDKNNVYINIDQSTQTISSCKTKQIESTRQIS